MNTTITLPGEKDSMEAYVQDRPAAVPYVDPRLTRSLRIARGVMGRSLAVLVGEIEEILA